MNQGNYGRLGILVWACVVGIAVSASAAEMEWIRVADDALGFVSAKSGKPFSPWGFNYDHDEKGRLIEDYWDKEWPKVEEDFREMKALGANVVRVHLQFGRFMQSVDRPNAAALAQLDRLFELAEKVGLYLDVTGLGCYHKADVPEWYDLLTEEDRWNAQAKFWDAVSERGAKHACIFCYDLMNEPVVPAGKRAATDWLGPAFGGKHFVQRISLTAANRPRHEIAQSWIRRLTAAIRKHDKRHLVTVGLVDWSLDRPGLTSGFVPEKIAPEIDFVAVHLYPEKGKLDEALDRLKGFAVGKPLIVEETFPLKCSAAELGQFIEDSDNVANGWIGFYWGRTAEECRQSKEIADALMLDWLELFRKRSDQKTKAMSKQ